MWQIQSIPTVTIYESRPSDPVRRDYGSGLLSLVSVVSLDPVLQSPPPDDAAGVLSLVSVEVAGAFPQAGAEDISGMLSLASCVLTVPLSRSVDDPGAASLSLVSVLQLLPVTRTINTDTPATANLSLLSCVV